MKVQDHWEKAGRIEASRNTKLDRREDYELVVWSCIHGGAHLVNAVLHHLNITPVTKDYIHSDKLEDGVVLPKLVEGMLTTLHAIELHGPRFVRGGELFDQKEIDNCVGLYEQLKSTTASVIF